MGKRGVCGEYDLSFSHLLPPQDCPSSVWACWSLQCSGRAGRWCCLPLIYSIFYHCTVLLSKQSLFIQVQHADEWRSREQEKSKKGWTEVSLTVLKILIKGNVSKISWSYCINDKLHCLLTLKLKLICGRLDILCHIFSWVLISWCIYQL